MDIFYSLPYGAYLYLRLAACLITSCHSCHLSLKMHWLPFAFEKSLLCCLRFVQPDGQGRAFLTHFTVSPAQASRWVRRKGGKRSSCRIAMAIYTKSWPPLSQAIQRHIKWKIHISRVKATGLSSGSGEKGCVDIWHWRRKRKKKHHEDFNGIV